MKSLTQHLFEEHQKIREKLALLKVLLGPLRKNEKPDLQHWKDLMHFFSSFADKVHHQKEELFLVPALIAKGFPYKGGPECSYFKTLQMMNTPLELEIRDIENLLGEEHEKIKVDTSIPILLEHVFGRKLLKAMDLIYERSEVNSSNLSILHSLVYRYTCFLEEHIDKENRCLFPMVDDTLNNEEQEDILNSMKALIP